MPAGFTHNLPSYQDACFVLDPNAGLTDGNLWVESSRNGLHVTPVNFTAPNYGIARTSKGAAYITFNGTTQYGTVPLRFYDRQPITALTFVVVAHYNSTSAANDRLFSARSSAPLRGIELSVGSTSANRLDALGFDGLGAWSGCQMAADWDLVSRRVVSIVGMTAGITNQSLLSVHDGDTVATLALGGSVVASWSTGPTAPLVGAMTGLSNYFDGALYFLGIWPRLFTDREACAMSTWLRDGGGA